MEEPPTVLAVSVRKPMIGRGKKEIKKEGEVTWEPHIRRGIQRRSLSDPKAPVKGFRGRGKSGCLIPTYV